MVNIKDRKEATNAVVESVRDLYSATITLPLGNPNLKLVHTNQFLFTELSEDVFELANFDKIATALNSTYTRFGGYVLNRWYIEQNTITNDGKTAKMELKVNPFPTMLSKFREDLRSAEKAYNDAFTKKTTSKKKVKSTVKKVTLKNVSGFNKSDQAYIKKVTETALKQKNYPTNELKRATAIYEHYNKNHVYNGYECMNKIIDYGFEGAWKKQGHNCGDGAATLCAMFRCNGFVSDIMHKYGHFYVRVKINGTWYYCDQAGDTNTHNWRTLGKGGGDSNVYHGISSSASVVGFRYCHS